MKQEGLQPVNASFDGIAGDVGASKVFATDRNALLQRVDEAQPPASRSFSHDHADGTGADLDDRHHLQRLLFALHLHSCTRSAPSPMDRLLQSRGRHGMTTIQFCPSRIGSKPYAQLPCVSLKSRAFEAISSKNAPL